jgi:hypothetical protein
MCEQDQAGKDEATESPQLEGGARDDDIKGMWDDDDDDDAEENLERDAHVLQLAEDGQGDALRQELSEYIGSLKDRVDEEGEKLVEFPQDFDEMLQVCAHSPKRPNCPSSISLDAIIRLSCASSAAYKFELTACSNPHLPTYCLYVFVRTASMFYLSSLYAH